MKRWSKSSKTIFVIASAAAVVTAAALSMQLRPDSSLSKVEPWIVPDISKADLDRAFTQASDWSIQSSGMVKAGITPHHALVGPIIAGWFTGLRQQPAPDTVVIIGPDHENSGVGYLTTADVDWKTPDGIVRVNRRLIDDLIDDGNVIIDHQLIQREHGVFNAIPFVRRVWPSAKVVTIAVKGDARSDRLNRLAQLLDEQLGADDLVLATVDFSHDTTAPIALQADQSSIDVIRRGDAIAAFDLPVDSPPAISLILTYAKRHGLSYQQLGHTTSAQFTGALDGHSTTSYVSAYFADVP